jgi:hypothetical protein
MGSTDPVTAIVERMMEKLQRENPGVNYKRKGKAPKPVKRKKKDQVH